VERVEAELVACLVVREGVELVAMMAEAMEDAWEVVWAAGMVVGGTEKASRVAWLVVDGAVVMVAP